MNKKEFVKYVAEKQNKSMREVEKSINLVLAGLESAVEEGLEVNLTGYFNLYIAEIKGRPVRNPQTNESMMMEDHLKTRIKLGNKLSAKYQK